MSDFPISKKNTFEDEKQILQIPENDIIYKSYIFGKNNIKVRVLYLKALEKIKLNTISCAKIFWPIDN